MEKDWHTERNRLVFLLTTVLYTVAYRGGGGWGVLGVQTPSEIPKALQNRAKLNPIVKTVKNC